MNVSAVPPSAGADGSIVPVVRLALPHGLPAAVARSTATSALTTWQLLHRSEDVLLVITELVQNVTQHTSNGGELRLAQLPDGILIEVLDASVHEPQLRNLDLRSLRGRGLLIIAAVARRWGSRPLSWAGHQGKVVWAEVAA